MGHYPHDGTQQMNGLLPPIPGPADQLNMNSIPSFNEHDLPELNGVSALEPLPEDNAMGTVITSGFDSAALNHKRSNSGSQVCPSDCPAWRFTMLWLFGASLLATVAVHAGPSFRTGAQCMTGWSQLCVC